MARILVVDDNHAIRTLLEHVLTQRGYELVLGEDGDQGVAVAAREHFDLVISDIRMPGAEWSEILAAARVINPDAQLILITAFASVQTAVAALDRQATAYLSKPFKVQQLVQTVEAALARAAELAQERRRLDDLKREVSQKYAFDTFVGTSPAMQRIYDLIRKVLHISSSILIEGESGTGKELVARAIHYNGSRSGGPFVAIDCGALPETLLESELFGHVRGAFTGAQSDKPGLLESAHGGTVFLDEIAHMSAALQARLLRVLETSEVRRVGAPQARHVDVRIIAATNRSLQELVDADEFRQDLFFRLKVITITLPPLRERREDIPLLVQHFVRRFSEQLRRPVRGVSKAALNVLCSHRWPGNVRELGHAIEQAVALSSDEEIQLSDLPLHLQQLSQPTHSKFAIQLPEEGLDLQETLREIEADLLQKALQKTGGVKDHAARLLGLNRTTFLEKLKRLMPSS